MDETLFRQRQQEAAIQIRQEQQEQANRQTVLNQQAEQINQEVNLTGQVMARGIAAQLPPALGDEEPAQEAFRTLSEEEVAALSKKERELYRQRQEEERLRREEEERLRLEQEKARRQEEKRLQQEAEEREEERIRQERRRLILEDDALREMLVSCYQEADPQLAMKKAEEFVRAASQKLMKADKEIADENGGTVEYAEMMMPFRILMLTQIDDADTAGALYDKSKEHEARFRELQEERVITSIANLELMDILKEEAMNLPLLKKATENLADQFDQKNTVQMGLWGDFEGVVARNVNLPLEGNSVNVFRSGSPYEYLRKKETQQEFQRKMEEKMHENASLSAEEALKEVCREHKEELKEKAASRTENGGVVSGVSREDWERHGGASFHYTLPAAQAFDVARQSNGFLYAKQCGDGLCELRPTLPETVEIDERQVPLRRTYNLFIKAFMHSVMDENGDLRKNVPVEKDGRVITRSAEELADDASYYFTDYGLSTKIEDRINFIKPWLLEALNGNEEQTQKVIDDYLTIWGKDIPFLPTEILSNFVGTIQRMKKTGENVSAVMRFAKVKEDMVKQGVLQEEIDGTMSQLVSPSLIERQHRVREAMLKQNAGAPLTAEQIERLEAIGSMYADMDQAVVEMMGIRNMDPDSPEVPLPNACSANGVFVRDIRRKFLRQPEEDTELITYRTDKHALEKPEEHIRYILDHFEELKGLISQGEKEPEKFKTELTELLERIKENRAAFTEDYWRRVVRITVNTESYSPSKYEYHVAANIGQTKQGEQITTEGFAAESKQYMVTAFSRHNAVGIYRGSNTRNNQDYTNPGMEAYYNHDNPLPSDEEAILAKTKIELSTNTLPGGAV